jgi:hypothetical protein
MGRRSEFSLLIPQLMWLEAGRPVTLNQLYVAIEQTRPDLVDDLPDPQAPGRPQWQHDLRWEIQTAVTSRRIVKLEEIGRSVYGPVEATRIAPAQAAASARLTALEQLKVESATAVVVGGVRAMLRTESALVRRYENWLVQRGLTLRRYDIRTAEAEQLWADAYDGERRLLIEAKSSGSRTAMRMAVGQLLDYRLSLEHEVRIAVLVPPLRRRADAWDDACGSACGSSGR